MGVCIARRGGRNYPVFIYSFYFLREDCSSCTTCYDLFFFKCTTFIQYLPYKGFELHVHSTASQLVAGAAFIP